MPSRKYVVRSPEEKQEILTYAEEHGPTAAGREFKVHTSLIRLWQRNGNGKVRTRKSNGTTVSVQKALDTLIAAVKRETMAEVESTLRKALH